MQENTEAQTKQITFVSTKSAYHNSCRHCVAEDDWSLCDKLRDEITGCQNIVWTIKKD